MSGRSAYVRKKITETKTGEQQGHGRGRAKSTTSSDNVTISDYPIGSMPALRQERDLVTGVGTTNARFLKFSEHAREDEMLAYRGDVHSYAPQSSGSQSGSSVDGRRDGASTSQRNRPLNDFAYARARRPVIKTEDVSGIEKSGLRSMLDKRSDDFRKGLAKTFAFKKKDKKGSNAEKAGDFRPESSATVRPSPVLVDFNDGYDADVSPVQYQPLGPHPGVPWDDTGMLSPPPSGKLPPTPGSSGAPPIKRWIGAGRPVQRWNKLRKDPELWDPNGDVLVFFGTKGQSPRPNPSFRLSSHIIEATESRYLITLLREGSTEEDIHLPPSPAGAPPMLQRHGGHGQHLAAGGIGRGGHPTPPVSEDNSWEADGQISYEMHFPTPVTMSKLDQFRHHITTRNVFAMLYHSSLVGLSLYQALTDLHSRLGSYMPPEADNVGTILNYLSARGIDDVRNDPETAVSLLAWSEGSDVRWEEGWRESFLHCAGMYSRLEACSDFRYVTPITRALLERACLETQLRVQAAEERLATFQYSDMWPAAVATMANASGPVGAAPAKAAADRLQNFLIQYYTREYGSWPPPLSPSGGADPYAIAMVQGIAEEEEEDIWLTRTVAQALQKDFAALYDYLVNRDIVWDVSEARSSRKWMMVSESGNRAFEADTEDLPMTDMLIEFDNKHRFPHVPHPHPLVPESIPPLSPNKDGPSSGGGGIFGNKSSKKAPATTSRAGALDRRIQLAYTEATNICILGSDFTHSDLIDAYSKFEKSDKIGEVDPATARRGRWALIYGVLQTLASVSVDAPNVRYRDNVTYHLSPRLKGNTKLPPWKTSNNNSNPTFGEASHELSHCWVIPQTWTSPSHHGGSSVSNSGAEENSTDEQDDYYSSNSPVYGYGGRSYNFPLPSSRAPSSVGGYRSNSKSLRSGGASTRAPSTAGGYTNNTFSSAASVMSYSETGSEAGGSSIWSPPPSSAGGSGSRRVTSSSRRRDNAKISVAPGGQGGRYIDPVEEREWAAPGQTYASRPGTGTGGGYSSRGGVMGVEESKEMDDGRSFTTAYTSRGDRERDRDRSRVRGGGKRENSSPPVIRDFDFDGLDVIDDHAP
ncbi:hypothetical protein QBC36DRAFT_367945 [Triangularia setosa]|uniref:DUF8004 domain-containing protein n=1 Tax=Triangularia setosa TaxID=2587417 RepID=A0AAN6WAN4_9PEZI|nr:hypothetical protein QBC36DRAFT_367945 [Podospora setosa]